MFLQSNTLLKESDDLYLQKIYFILFYELLANIVYVCDTFLWWHQRSEEWTVALGMVTDGCESPDMGSGTKSKTSETAAVFLNHQE